MGLTIDIFHTRELAWNQRRAVRRVVTPPDLVGVKVLQFNYGNGGDAEIILRRGGGIDPARITYIRLHDSADTTRQPTEYYVTSFDWQSEQDFKLNLMLNPWVMVTRDKVAFIRRSNFLPSSALMRRPERGLNFNQVKAAELAIVDQFGNRSPDPEPAWGFLYMNRIASGQDPLQVELSNIQYNIVSNQLPTSPDRPQGPVGNQLAFFNNFSVLNSPQPSNQIQRGITYAYNQESIDVSGIPLLPGNLQNRAVNAVASWQAGAVFGGSGSVVFLTRNDANQFRAAIVSGVAWDVTPQGGIANCRSFGGATTLIRWGAPSTIISQAINNAVNARESQHLAQQILIRPIDIGWVPSSNVTWNSATMTLSWPGGSQVMTNSFNAPQGNLFGPNAINDNFTPVPFAGEGRTIGEALTAGVFRHADNRMFEYTFGNNPPQTQAGPNATRARVWTGPDVTQSTTVTAINIGSHSWFLNVVQGQPMTTMSVFFNSETSFNTQSSFQGNQVFEHTVIRRRFLSSTITPTQVALNNISGNPLRITNQTLTRDFVRDNLPSDSTAWFMNAGVTFPNPGISMPQASAFTNNGLATTFVVNNPEFNNVTFQHRAWADMSGFYRDGQNVFRVTQSERTIDINAPMTFTVTTNEYDTNTFGLIGNTSQGSGNANVRLNVTHLGDPELIDTIIDFQLDSDAINNGTLISEPYAVLAVPLFSINYRTTTGGPLLQANLLQTQRVFYDFIRRFGGGSSPQIADAQIFPYAPQVFKDAHVIDSDGEWLNMAGMNMIGAQSGGSPTTSIPYVILDNANIRFSWYGHVRPYVHPRKEATLRKLRLAAPNFSSIFDFNYYDFNNEITNWGSDNNNADMRIDVEITLRPVEPFVIARPFTRDNTLMGTTEHEDFRGLVLSGSMFQATMTSSAYETFRRENTMYQQIQQRRVDTLQIQHDVERQNDVVNLAMGTLQGTFMGAMAGSSLGGSTLTGSLIGGGLGGAAAGITAGAALAYQNIQNERLRARERSDQKFYFEANIANVKAQPDTLNRVSGFNSTMLRRFSIRLEIYAPTEEEVAYYDQHIDTYGHEIGVTDNLQRHLIQPCFVQAELPFSSEPPHIHNRLNEDLQKGVYYYESI